MDVGELERLVERVGGGDEAAWQLLWRELEGPLSRIIAQPSFLGRLGQREDDRRNIIVAVMAKLRADGFHRVRVYLEARRANPQLTFVPWLRVVAKRAGIDYMRRHPDWVKRDESQASAPGRWVDPKTLPPASQIVGARPPLTDRGTAQQLLAFAAGAIPEAQLRALQMWAASEPFEAIARDLGLASADDAEKIVRAAIQRVRREYR